MAERIEMPPPPMGDEKTQIRQMWNYLANMAEQINRNTEELGANSLTDYEQKVMQPIMGGAYTGRMDNLKTMIIRLAEYVQKKK